MKKILSINIKTEIPFFMAGSIPLKKRQNHPLIDQIKSRFVFTPEPSPPKGISRAHYLPVRTLKGFTAWIPIHFKTRFEQDLDKNKYPSLGDKYQILSSGRTMTCGDKLKMCAWKKPSQVRPENIIRTEEDFLERVSEWQRGVVTGRPVVGAELHHILRLENPVQYNRTRLNVYESMVKYIEPELKKMLSEYVNQLKGMEKGCSNQPKRLGRFLNQFFVIDKAFDKKIETHWPWINDVDRSSRSRLVSGLKFMSLESKILSIQFYGATNGFNKFAVNTYPYFFFHYGDHYFTIEPRSDQTITVKYKGPFGEAYQFLESMHLDASIETDIKQFFEEKRRAREAKEKAEQEAKDNAMREALDFPQKQRRTNRILKELEKQKRERAAETEWRELWAWRDKP